MKNLLHFGAAFGLGAGIWAMHFIGMLAFKMDMVMTYDPWLTALSMIIAITVAFFALLVTRSRKFNMRRVTFAAVVLGIAISSMHYTGMAAMEMDGDIRYIPSFFALSIIIGILASGIAISIIYYLGHYHAKGKEKSLWIVLAALIMGAGVSGMHYMGMIAAVFIPYADCRFDPNQEFHILALSVAAVTSILLAIALSLLIYSKEQEARKTDDTRDHFPTKIISLTSVLSVLYILILLLNRLYDFNILPENIKNNRYEQYIAFSSFAVLSVLWIFSYRGLRQWRRDLVKTRNNLKAEKAQLSAIMKFMMQGVITIDSAGVIKSVNKWAEDSLGYNMSELVGRDIGVIIPEHQISRLSGSERIITAFRKDGSSFLMRLSLTETKTETSSVFVALFRDITEQINKERELKAAKEQAEKANQAKSDFLANMSHELRTPLNSIMGIVHIFMHDKNLDKDKRDMASIVQKSAISLLQTVNDILDLSKIEAGSIALEKTSFDLKDTVSDVTESISVIASSKDIALNIHYEQDNIPYLVGDPFRLNRILTNLLSNAVKYTDKGRVDIVINCIPLPFDMHPKTVEIECIIKDTGIGITQEQLNIIFDKFTQADESITRKYGGTGLGLAIAKDLVDLMGGSIGVESEFGQGSRFWFKIPFETADKIAPHKGDRQGDETQNSTKTATALIKAEDAKILVVEDHPLNQTFIEILLERMGLGTIDVVENGALAVKACLETHYDLILMDCHMPEKNGYEATIEIREHENPDKHIPIIALTADAMMGTRQKCLDAGMDKYMTKPVDVDQLQDILSQWISFERKKTEDTSKNTDHEKIDDENQPPVDLSALEAYADTPEEMQQYISVFLKQAKKDLESLAQHCQDGKSKDWVEIAHKLKGGAGMAGALHMQQLCAEAQAMENATLKERAALLKAIRQAFADVQDFLEKI